MWHFQPRSAVSHYWRTQAKAIWLCSSAPHLSQIPTFVYLVFLSLVNTNPPSKEANPQAFFLKRKPFWHFDWFYFELMIQGIVFSWYSHYKLKMLSIPEASTARLRLSASVDQTALLKQHDENYDSYSSIIRFWIRHVKMSISYREQSKQSF